MGGLEQAGPQGKGGVLVARCGGQGANRGSEFHGHGAQGEGEKVLEADGSGGRTAI